ncbi:MAG: hypothetical protein LBK24_01860, partial [Puniceicoccales bacterium]|nr:hypothetical protein [Puniceicoccales bacterium]
ATAQKGLDNAIKRAKEGITKEFEANTRELMHEMIENAVNNTELPADKRISREVAEGYHQAVDYDMSAFGGGMILPQFGGQLLGTKIEPSGDGYALHINFGVSKNIKNLAAAFGNEDVVGAFTKLVKDLPFLPTDAEREVGERVTDLGERAKEAEQGTPQELTTGGAVKLTMKKLEDTPKHPDPLIHPDPTVLKGF